jgi:hypothetical protein
MDELTFDPRSRIGFFDFKLKKSLVTVDLIGGLGNQLFQYAIARAIAHARGGNVALNLEWFDAVRSASVTTRHYALAPFLLPVALVRPWYANSRALLYFNKALKRIGVRRSYFRETDFFSFDPTALSAEPPIHLSGYWQSWKYFEGISDLLKRELGTPRNLSAASTEMLQRIKSCDAICVHVRRGDYVSNAAASNLHGTCGLDYYRSAMSVISAPLKNPYAFVFTDDPGWVRENFVSAVPFTVVDINAHEQAHQDLWLMAACSHFVIANSSLSWWGAWLSTAQEKTVICPRKWFKGGDHDTSDLLPEEWIRM